MVMKIVSIEDLHADAGWRTLSFLKITTDDGLVGWSEFSDGRSAPALTMAIRKLADGILGEDPRAISRLGAKLYAMTRSAAGGMTALAIAAIENACLDIKAKALGVPVYELFGGVFRQRLPLYWSHCGTSRLRHAKMFEAAGAQPLRSLDDVVRLGQEVVTRGYGALKTNVLLFDGDGPSNHQPGFGGGDPALNINSRLIGGIVDLMSAFREGAGDSTGLMLDLNFNFKTEGVRQIARALESVGLMWLELDLYDPAALASIRQSTRTPIAGLETIYGRRDLRAYLNEQAVDVAIIDVQWNGMMEAMRMASLFDAYDINVASHNYHGHLSTLMGAHFSAAIPNFRIMEFEVDEPAWMGDLVTHPITIDTGYFVVPQRPGWGTDINEEAVLQHPPKSLGGAEWMLDWHSRKRSTS
jgi:galactonate dehydratase